MHQHSDKIEPKKLMVTIFFTILFIIAAIFLRKDRNEIKNSDTPVETTSTKN